MQKWKCSVGSSSMSPVSNTKREKKFKKEKEAHDNLTRKNGCYNNLRFTICTSNYSVIFHHDSPSVVKLSELICFWYVAVAPISCRTAAFWGPYVATAILMPINHKSLFWKLLIALFAISLYTLKHCTLLVWPSAYQVNVTWSCFKGRW